MGGVTVSKALTVSEAGGGFVLDWLRLDAPRSGEVTVRVEASGLCHTDLHAMGGKYPVRFPAVFGHEGAGVVEAVGPDVEGLAEGDRVALAPDHCGACKQCRSGRPAYCAEIPSLCFAGRRRDGTTAFSGEGGPVSSHFFGQSSLAQLSNVSARCVVPIDQDVPFEVAAPLGCAGQTGVGTILNELRAVAGETVAVFGVGAVGLFSVMAAVAVGCEVLAVDRDPSRLELAAQVGAHRQVRAEQGRSLAEVIRGLVPPGIDHAVDTTGVPAVIEQAFLSLGYCGSLALVGASSGSDAVSLPVGGQVRRGWRLYSVIEGGAVSAKMIPQMVEMWRSGKLPVERVVEVFDMGDASTALSGMRSGRVVKPVIRMQ